jgi:hypothetical protein
MPLRIQKIMNLNSGSEFHNSGQAPKINENSASSTSAVGNRWGGQITCARFQLRGPVDYFGLEQEIPLSLTRRSTTNRVWRQIFRVMVGWRPIPEVIPCGRKTSYTEVTSEISGCGGRGEDMSRVTCGASLSILRHNSRNRRVRSAHGCFVARYRYLSRRFSLVKVCTQDRNCCSPSKLALPSAATSSSFLFSRA